MTRLERITELLDTLESNSKGSPEYEKANQEFKELLFGVDGGSNTGFAANQEKNNE